MGSIPAYSADTESIAAPKETGTFDDAIAVTLNGDDNAPTVSRLGWRNKFHLAMSDHFDGTVIRVNEDGSAWPWTPTEDDLFASDWEYDNGLPVVEADVASGSFPWAMRAIRDGKTVTIGSGPLKLCKGETHGIACIDIVLPNGTRRLWRPQQQDLRGRYEIEVAFVPDV